MKAPYRREKSEFGLEPANSGRHLLLGLWPPTYEKRGWRGVPRPVRPCATDKRCWAKPRILRKIPCKMALSREFWVGDRFADDCAHHHPVVLNRRNRLRPEIGHFCGDIRRPCSAFSVSEDIRSLSGLFLTPGLCIQKFRSRRLRFDGQYRSVNSRRSQLTVHASDTPSISRCHCPIVRPWSCSVPSASSNRACPAAASNKPSATGTGSATFTDR